jgi:hypothetical protein
VNADNASLGPPPLATPITADQLDEEGIPFQSRGVPTGNLHTAWGQWFNRLIARVSGSAVILRDTSANRTNYPAGKFPGALYQETDYGDVTYISRTTSGTVTTAGAAVAWISGDMFSAADLGTGQITINGVIYNISAVTSPTALTLTSTAGVQVGVAYSAAAYQWCYFSGTYSAGLASIPTLGAADIGFKFFDTANWRLFQWATLGGAPSSLSPGWARGNGELPTAAMQVLPLGPGTSPGLITGWSTANGGAVNITQDDATILLFTKPSTFGAFPKGGALAAYTGAQIAAVLPTISGHTEVAATGISVSAATVSTGTALAGATQPVVTALTGGGGGVTDPQHQHNLTAANAPIALPGDPVVGIILPWYVKR